VAGRAPPSEVPSGYLETHVFDHLLGSTAAPALGLRALADRLGSDMEPLLGFRRGSMVTLDRDGEHRPGYRT